MTSQSDEDVKKAEQRKRIEYQVSCEERAHRIVERLIDNPITEEMLCNSLQYVTQSHYSDIVEERAVSKLCGYPVCPNDLGSVPKQKYMISTKTNKVYDLEARKNFCSGKCYKASKHLERQINNAPVWSRKNLPPLKFDLFPLDSKIGKLGDEVLVSKSAEIKEDVEKLDKVDKYYEDLEKKKQQNVDVVHGMESPKIDNNTKLRESNETASELSKGLQKVNITSECGRLECGEQTEEVLVDSAASGDKGITSNTDKGLSKSDSTVKEFTEPHCVKVKKSNKTSGKGSGKSKRVDKSKTDYLMQLLDKRKALLSKMADVQESVNISTATKEPTLKSDENELNSKVLGKGSNTDCDIPNNTLVPGKSDKSVNDSERLTSKCIEEIPNETIKSDSVEHDSVLGNVNESRTVEKKTKGNCGKKVVSTVELLCEGIKCWITKETAEYLKDNVKDTVEMDVRLGKPEFEKQYKALIAKVDAQETDFDALLGEELMESDIKAVAPLPHFNVLKEELMGDQQRVEEFMKGSYVYKVTEKHVDLKTDSKDRGIVLPTVDRYDQIVIRQKLVLERVSRVLPDTLSPLHLLVQEVFTELRELICTFNLTSENILYKPAEWTIVTIILLRMLSMKLQNVRDSFCQPQAVKYFSTLLSGINSSLQQIDTQIHAMFVENVDRK